MCYLAMVRRSIGCVTVWGLLAFPGWAATLPAGTLVAGAAFNDDDGLYSNPTPDSPYTLGATALWRGEGEPGWAVGWTVSVGGSNPPFGSYYGDIRGDVTLEGDGALRMRNRPSPFEQLWMHRRWSTPLAEPFRIDQHVNIPAGGSFGSRPFRSGSGSLISRIGPTWSASNGKFYAGDGNGQGSAPGEFTGFTWEPDTWYKVSLIVDPPSQTFEFLINDQKYDAHAHASLTRLTSMAGIRGRRQTPDGTNHGTLSDGAAIVTDPQRGNVLDLDGINDYVSLNRSNVPGGPTDTSVFTIAAWIKIPDGEVIDKKAGGIYGEYRTTYGHTKNFLVAGRLVGFDQYHPSGGGLQSVTLVNDGTWHHVAYVQNEPGGFKRTLYIDGTPESYDNAVETYTGEAPNMWAIGARLGTSRCCPAGRPWQPASSLHRGTH